MAYFPFFIELENKQCLVVGGGDVAYRKVQALLEFGVNINMVALEYCAGLLELCEQVNSKKQLTLNKKKFCEDDLNDVLFVIAATNNQQLNQQISQLCHDKNIMINVVDDKEKCSFYFPSLIKKGEVVIGISSGGNSPVLSKNLRKKIETTVPNYYADLNSQLGEIREYIKENIALESLRKQCFQEVFRRSEEKQRKLNQDELETIFQYFIKN